MLRRQIKPNLILIQEKNTGYLRFIKFWNFFVMLVTTNFNEQIHKLLNGDHISLNRTWNLKDQWRVQIILNIFERYLKQQNINHRSYKIFMQHWDIYIIKVLMFLLNDSLWQQELWVTVSIFIGFSTKQYARKQILNLKFKIKQEKKTSRTKQKIVLKCLKILLHS